MESNYNCHQIGLLISYWWLPLLSRKIPDEVGGCRVFYSTPSASCSFKVDEFGKDDRQTGILENTTQFYFRQPQLLTEFARPAYMYLYGTPKLSMLHVWADAHVNSKWLC